MSIFGIAQFRLYASLHTLEFYLLSSKREWKAGVLVWPEPGANAKCSSIKSLHNWYAGLDFVVAWPLLDCIIWGRNASCSFFARCAISICGSLFLWFIPSFFGPRPDIRSLSQSNLLSVYNYPYVCHPGNVAVSISAWYSKLQGNKWSRSLDGSAKFWQKSGRWDDRGQGMSSVCEQD